MHVFVGLIFLTSVVRQTLPSRKVYTNHWAVRVSGGREEADKLALKYGYNNLGQIGSLEDHYHFHHSKIVRRSAFATRGTHSFIRMDPKVRWIQQQVVKTRVKRTIRTNQAFGHFNDPEWSSMWYIHCGDKSGRCRSEMNILAAWQRGYTGKNVVVTILDDGIEKNHPDLAQNYDQLASYDINGNDHDPTPRYDASNYNKHGTRCAGEVAAAANNSHCIVGIAFNARIGGIRMLDGDVTDLVEAKSLGIQPDYIDIYSASWGPEDDGKTVDGPGPLTKMAFEQGIEKGRKGLGSIFVWASGNGGRQGDHCSCDGYINSIYTISVGSSTESGTKPWYLEVCSSTLVTSYSSGEFYDRKIMTTDLHQRCTDSHTGTSVSAPMVAGIIALALEANHLYGFGLVDAEAMVVEAKRWKNVPPQHVCRKTSENWTRYIHANQYVNSTISTSGCVENAEQHVAYLEHVEVMVLITHHPRRGDLQISLISPAGTRTQLLAQRQYDNSNEGFRHWVFMTVHSWGEKAEGQWTLEVLDSPSPMRNPTVFGKLKEWTLILYGTSKHPYLSHSSQLSRSRKQDVPVRKGHEVPQDVPEAEQKEEYSGPCHKECGDQGCDGPAADHCLNCVHFSLGSFEARRQRRGSLEAGRMCVSHCPVGYYEDTDARRCRWCPRGCERCGSVAGEVCTSCRRGLYLNASNSTCVKDCPVGYFTDEAQRRCLKCHENCMACHRGPDICTACNDGYSLAGMTCVPECADGTFFNIEEMKCSSCHHSCSTCTGPGKEECIQCTKGFLQQDWSCVPTCSEGYYAIVVPRHYQRRCYRCRRNCLSCQGPGTTCVRCADGYSLVGGGCVVKKTCNNVDEIFCEMVVSNRLCEKTVFRQFCCKLCVMKG